MISKTATGATATATVSTSGGTGFAGLLTIAFIVLKLTHVIDWSWWWVTSPLWITGLLYAALLLLLGVGFLIYYFFHQRALKRRLAANRAARQKRGW
jgi:phosphoglycerol transferase MdoB-like AlkP superfamily enzyme